jgi:hypothetical protein
MDVMWAVKDMISGQYVQGNSYWSCSLGSDIDSAHLWRKEAHAKAFITTNRDQVKSMNTAANSGAITMVDLLPIPIEVSRKEA